MHEIPYRLRRVGVRGPISALLFQGGPRDLLALCTCFGPGFPTVYALARGFLIHRPKFQEGEYPGTIRLRSLAPWLLLPIDAELEPALLDDEAAVLTKHQGLVFLPGGLVLGFDPARPLRLGELIQTRSEDVPTRSVGTRAWRPLPRLPEYADQVREVVLERPNDTVESILAASGEGIGEEPPRPAASDPVTRLAGEGIARTGQGLQWLGTVLGWRGLAGLGARLIEAAVRQVPRVSESLLGKQEAALRELLRQFREGRLEDALRRALPLGGQNDRGSSAAQDARLPRHNLFYNLGELLGLGRGPAQVWYGGGKLQAELETEYRKAAEAALRQGDHRRAAYISARLLGDYRMAADVLSRGGLHHDAAIVYLEKLGDELAAARSFEAGGEVDRALGLYRQRGEHALAGDLLRRVGELEQALAEYRIAANRLVAEHNHYAAGNLLEQHAERADLALEYFAAGWAGRPHGSALACLHRLTALTTRHPDPKALFQLLAEADELFGRPGLEKDAARFYNDVATLAGSEASAAWAAAQGELRDRALQGLAHKIRQRAETDERPGTTISVLLGQSCAWPAALVRDAEHALRNATRQQSRRRRSPGVQRCSLLSGRVTAVCAAPGSGDLFLGFASGGLIGFRPGTGNQVVFPSYAWRVCSLATDPHGDHLLVLYRENNGSLHLHGYRRHEDGSYRATVWRSLSRLPDEPIVSPPRLIPLANEWGIPAGGLWDGRTLFLLRSGDFLPEARWTLPFPAEDFATAFIGGTRTPLVSLLSAVLMSTDAVWVCDSTAAQMTPVVQEASHPLEILDNQCYQPIPLGWFRSSPEDGWLETPVHSWLASHPTHLELAGVDAGGILYHSALQLALTSEGPAIRTCRVSDRSYRAAALVRAGRVAAIAANGVAWLSTTGTHLVATGWTPADLPDALAGFVSPGTNELLIVCREGDLVRVALPT
jgi:tetratricopeptide (TPR) repeat protein